MIRKLKAADIEDVIGMETGIEDDYVIRIFSKLIEEDYMLGYFEGDTLVGIAGITIFEEEVAVLGRLRTHMNYRGRGIASTLMKQLKEEAFHSLGMQWVGYATEKHNKAGNRLARNLQMNFEATIVSSRISPNAVAGTYDTQPYRFDFSRESKNKYLEEFSQNEDLPFFPHSIYYPLPYVPTLTTSYLDTIEMYQNDLGTFMIMKEEKGASYLHVKVWNERTLHSKEMWQIVNAEAEREARSIWIDLPTYQAKSLEAQSHQTIWHLYGIKRS
ncbi:GNAT family N-acetyltransferase [Bacillus sp. NTK071]|uniref:GNAT family N-acetyltransferase n=1 Tax=Bacillus sp. NTK071 TaxID=2802175 RepID=UPI001A8FB3DC|nr:GNAT family N-acetyltransferase [Bacillus sp. NTK071]MBN8207973.1 GNAT family N-acetyltransferase [Bacillus sp. NTK071]